MSQAAEAATQTTPPAPLAVGNWLLATLCLLGPLASSQGFTKTSVCISTSALQIDSSVPFFRIPCVCIYCKIFIFLFLAYVTVYDRLQVHKVRDFYLFIFIYLFFLSQRLLNQFSGLATKVRQSQLLKGQLAMLFLAGSCRIFVSYFVNRTF